MISVKVISVRVDEETKRKMERLKHINWANVIREAIRRRIELEEAMLEGIDKARAMRASEDMERLRAKTTGRWRGVEEVRRWRELRR